MSEVGTPPPHNLDKPHELLDSINNNNCKICVVDDSYVDIACIVQFATCLYYK